MDYGWIFGGNMYAYVVYPDIYFTHWCVLYTKVCMENPGIYLTHRHVQYT